MFEYNYFYKLFITLVIMNYFDYSQRVKQEILGRKDFLEKIIPKHGNYKHPSNAHSHLRSMLLSPDKTLPIINGQAVFGTWQSLVFVETDVYPRRRTIIMQVLGE